MRLLFFVFSALSVVLSGTAQNSSDVLFTTGDSNVTVEEFRYIYEKTNAKDANYSEKSLNEYLHLFQNFKLKVKSAREQNLDKNPDYITELEGYKKQLTNSYLFDKQVKESLAFEAYDRKHTDVNFSHILFKATLNGNPKDTLNAYNKAMAAYLRLEKGEDFATLAREVSEDENSKNKGGDMGYYTALFPDGYYELENAVYKTESGKFSKPVKTTLGYHIVKINNKRTARGEIEIAHILLRATGSGIVTPELKNRANEIYEEIQKSLAFNSAAMLYSEDSKTKEKGGYLGVFGINQFEKGFEDAAFSLQNNNDISRPVQTKLGLHIIKRIDKKELPPKQEYVNFIAPRIANSDREIKAKDKLIRNIKTQNRYNFNENVYTAVLKLLEEEEIAVFNWKAPEIKAPKVLFSLENEWTKKVFTDEDFLKYLESSSRLRMNRFRAGAVDRWLREFVNEFEFDMITAFEEQNLERTNPEFRLLMKEYEEGLLFFEISKKEVWDKAAEDSIGLKAYFEANKDRYMTPKTADISMIFITTDNEKLAKKIHKEVSKKGIEGLLAKFNTETVEVVNISQKKFDVVNNPTLPESMKWENGEISALKKSADSYSFYKIVSIEEPKHKKLEETRGFVIADYQNVLEKKWIDELRIKYPVEVKKDVLKSLVKK